METPTRATARPFRGSRAVGLGLITWDRLLGPHFRKLHPDVYVGADAEIDTPARVVALSTWGGEHGVVAGPLAALAYGADCPWDDPEIVVPQHCRRPPDGVTARCDRLPDDEVALRFGCRVTTPVRTAFDLGRRGPWVEAVAAVDSLAHVARFDAGHLRALLDRHRRARGTAQLRTVLDLMDPRAESLPETRLRLGLVDRGVPPAVPQVWVTLLTGEQVRLDLAWPHRKYALEYNGPEHRTITGQNRDAFRTGRLDDVGWEVDTVTSAMVNDPKAFDELAVRVLRKVG